MIQKREVTPNYGTTIEKQGFDQATAHIKISEKYNYSKEASEFYDNIKKYKDRE